MAKTLSPVDTLIRNACVLTLDDSNTLHPQASIGISGGKISGIYTSGDLPKARDVIDATGFVAMPGLINAHSHAAMTLLRGIADDLPLHEWLTEHIFPAEARLVTPEFIKVGVALAACEMIRSGTTFFSDMYFYEDIAAEIIRDIGMKAAVGEGILGFPTPRSKTPQEALGITEALIAQWKGDSWIFPVVAPHSVYTCPSDILEKAAALSEEHDIPLHTHLSETAQEVAECFEKNKMSPVVYLKERGVLSSRLTAAHCVHLSDKDIELLAESGSHIIHNPESNMKLSSGIAPISKCLKSGINVALGTDGAASNNDLDMFGEIGTAAKLAKVISGDPTALSAREVLRIATRGGAKALHVDDQTGSLETGKSADIILIDFQKPHLTPLYNVESHLAYATRGSDVDTVIVEGRVLMRHRKLTTIDENKILAQAAELGRRIAHKESGE